MLSVETYKLYSDPPMSWVVITERSGQTWNSGRLDRSSAAMLVNRIAGYYPEAVRLPDYYDATN